jgi:hypothetical protein
MKNNWEKMTGIFEACRGCKYRKGNDCLYDGECKAVEEKAEILAEAYANYEEMK